MPDTGVLVRVRNGLEGRKSFKFAWHRMGISLASQDAKAISKIKCLDEYDEKNVGSPNILTF